MQRELEPPDVGGGLLAHRDGRVRAPRPTGGVEPGAVLSGATAFCVRSRSGARTPTSPDDVAVLEGGATPLRRYRDDGWRAARDCRGSRRSRPDANARRTRPTPFRADARSCSTSHGRSSTARTAPGRPSAGAASRCRAWASSSSSDIGSTRALPLRRRRTAGSGLCAAAWVRLSRGAGVLRC